MNHPYNGWFSVYKKDRVETLSCQSLFLNAELVLADTAEGALEIVADFFPLLALLVLIIDPAADFANIFYWFFLLIFWCRDGKPVPYKRLCFCRNHFLGLFSIYFHISS